ncbi:hypothetical protein E1A91_D03G054500v1 [Gossypium mustelinum]|uniref:PDZ domain-containing protein n=1 Tax=Gossypium mustelinum TaxID=34275 RepID=A0A5D2VJB7_GOSMU|nr:hypothetical protein E1A91_D03G054500v1 [Gossypium mustelinum]
MSSAVIAGASSSCSAAFTSRKNCSNKTTSTPSPKAFNTSQKTALQGLSLQEAKRGVSDFFIAEKKSSVCSSHARRGLKITARTAGASKTIEVEVDKPLGLTLGQKQGGGVVITGVDGGGNAAKAGLKAGDQVLYTSSFFGDELWPADKLGFTKTAIQAKPDSVYFVVSRCIAEVQKLMLNDYQNDRRHLALEGNLLRLKRQELLIFALTADIYTLHRNLLMSSLIRMDALNVKHQRRDSHHMM